MGLATNLQKIVRKAKQIQRTLGIRSAAGYLRNREATFEEAYEILFGRKPRLV